MPQYLYTHNSKGDKIIDYVIKYENISDFNKLMDKYQLDINYIKKTPKKRKFNIEDISIENIKLINKVYDLDFKYYNYERII